MGAYKTVAITQEQFHKIIECLKLGIKSKNIKMSPKPEVAFVLTAQANLGLRIGDVLKMKLKNIVHDGDRLRLDIIEEKTNKKREFTVPTEIYDFILDYCLENGIRKDRRIVNLTERSIQKNLKKVVDYLGYKNISTHSFRKYFATSIYTNNNYNIMLVKELLQHSSVNVTQKYIGISSKEIEDALTKHIDLPY